jgi:hypothetical protein
MLDFAQSELYFYKVKFNENQIWSGLRRILNGGMGPEVRTRSCRPKIHIQTKCLGLVFYVCDFRHPPANE